MDTIPEKAPHAWLDWFWVKAGRYWVVFAVDPRPEILAVFMRWRIF